ANVKEGDPIAEPGAVRIPREDRTAFGIDFGDHMHPGFRTQVSQHPFDIARCREFSRAPRHVSHFEYDELDRCVESYVNPNFGDDAGLHMFEDAVAETMPGDVRTGATDGQRHRRPEIAALFIANVEGLSARVADRIVV